MIPQKNEIFTISKINIFFQNIINPHLEGGVLIKYDSAKNQKIKICVGGILKYWQNLIWRIKINDK